MPSLGSSGPKSKFSGVGSTITAFTGFTYLWNHLGAVKPPVGSQGVYPDYVSGTIAATAVLAALEYRNRTGQGLAIDLSQAEAAAYMIAPSLMQAANLDGEPAPVGNRSGHAAPQGCYPCKGRDRWVAISVESDQQWRGLATAIGSDDLMQADHLNNAAGRHDSHDVLDQIITAWTIDRDCYHVMETLTKLGIPAGVVQNGADLLSDSHLRSRDFFVYSDDTRIGPITLPRFPVKFKNCPLETHWQFPELGRDTEAVLQALLGYDRHKIESMKRDGLLE
jgi:benzylsuccinate CoA-transferase BbsF subunit